MEYLGWWIEELEERNKTTGSFVCDNFSFIVLEVSVPNLELSFIGLFVGFFFIKSKEKLLFLLQNWSHDPTAYMQEHRTTCIRKSR